MRLRARLLASTGVLWLLGAGEGPPPGKAAPVAAPQDVQTKAAEAKAPQAKAAATAAPRAKATATAAPRAKSARVKAPQARAAQAQATQRPAAREAAEAEAAPALGVEELAWLAGRWEGLHDDVLTEETWLEPRGGLMLGVQRSVSEAQTDFRYLRLEQSAEGVHLVASAGAQATRLRVVETAPWRIVFAHPGLAWPQRVQYARTAGGTLYVRLEGVRDGKPTVRQWTARRVDREVQAAATER